MRLLYSFSLKPQTKFHENNFVYIFLWLKWLSIVGYDYRLLSAFLASTNLCAHYVIICWSGRQAGRGGEGKGAIVCIALRVPNELDDRFCQMPPQKVAQVAAALAERHSNIYSLDSLCLRRNSSGIPVW